MAKITPKTEPGTPTRSQIKTTWNSPTSQATGLKTVAAAMLGLLLPNVALAAATAPVLKAVADGFVFGGESDTPQVHFVGSPQEGYDVVFERQLASSWEQAATFPQGQVWSVYADWRDSWYTAPHHIKVQQVESIAGGRVRARASADIAGQQWEVADVYSVEQGMVRIDRSFATQVLAANRRSR